MGELVQFPNCRQITPEAGQRISERTGKAAYWVRRWSEIYSSLYGEGSEQADASLLQDASYYLESWLQNRNRAAIKARGF